MGGNGVLVFLICEDSAALSLDFLILSVCCCGQDDSLIQE